MIDRLSKYVESVVEGKESDVNEEIGMAISNALDAAEVNRPEDFHANFQGRLQDMVMVSYINSLMQTQLAIADKLSSVL